MSLEEIKHANSFRYEKDKNCFITSRMVLKYLLSYYTKTQPEIIKLQYTCHGKPYYINKQNVQFNISHSHEYVVLAFVLIDKVGIDIEYHENNIDIFQLYREVFSLLEAEEFHKCNSIIKKKDFFYRIWTLKEAFLKGKGKGFLDDILVNDIYLYKNLLSNAYKARYLSYTKEFKTWNLYELKPFKDYSWALALKNDIKKIYYFELPDITSYI